MSILDGWNFARPTMAYGVVDGVLVSFAADAPRILEDGLLIESARTNHLLRSAELDDPVWSKVYCTISPNSTSAPDESMTADKLVGAAGTNVERVEQAVACSIGEQQTISIFAKAIPGETQWLFFRLADGTAPAVWFDLINGVLGSTQSGWVNGQIEALADGWFRISASFAATQITHTIRFGPCDDGTTTSFTGDGSKGLYLWGAQWEVSDQSSSYFPTGAATATRAADTASRVWSPQASGYLYVEFVNPPVQDDHLIDVIGMDAGSLIYVAKGVVGTSNGDEALLSGAILATGQNARAVLTWGIDGRKICAEGRLAKDANDIGTITSLSLGSFGGASTYVVDLALVDGVELSDEDCLSMTGGAVLEPVATNLLTIDATANDGASTKKVISGTFAGTEVFYAGQQGSEGFKPGAGLLGIYDPNDGNSCEFTFYQYGATLKNSGQLFEMFLNSDPTGVADLSVRGIVTHHGARINARNGTDTISTVIASLDDRAGLALTGSTSDMPEDLRIGHGRSDGVFAFVTGIGSLLEEGTEVARIGEEGLRLKQRDTEPTPPEGYTVLWAKTDGTVQKTSNVGGVTSTEQL